MARDINVNAHPYPSNFSSLPQEERNAYFTKAARDYDARKAKARAPEEPPLRNSDHGEGEPQWEPDNALAERRCASARPGLGIGASDPEAKDAGASPVTFMPKRYKYRDPSTIPPREFLYGRHYIRQFLSATVAPGGVGKSGLSIVECLAMVECRALLGERPVKPLNVWYSNLEDPDVEIELRIAAAQLHFNVDPEAMQERLSFNSGRDMSLDPPRRRGSPLAGGRITMTIPPRVTLGASEAPSLITKSWIRSPQIADSEARNHG